MALGGCASCLKYLLIVWNFIILLFGIAILGVGIWMVVDSDSERFVDNVAPDDGVVIDYRTVSDLGVFSSLSYVLIAFGAITVVIAFLGYCGAIKESQCMLGTCFVLLFIIFAALIGIGVYLYIKKDKIDVDREKLYPLLKKRMENAVANYNTDQASKDFMDDVQTKYSCCGVENGVSDWAPAMTKPSSCTVLNSLSPCLPPYYDHVKSIIGVRQFFQAKMTVSMAVALGVAGALTLAMILTLILCCSVRRSGSYNS